MPGKTSFHDRKKMLKWLGTIVLVAVILAATLRNRQLLYTENTDDGLPNTSQSETLQQAADNVDSNGELSINNTVSQGEIEMADDPQSTPSVDDNKTASESSSATQIPEENQQERREQLTQWTGILLGESLQLEGEALLTELQMRLDRADNIENLDLEGLPYAARCALLMQWGVQHYETSFGLVDLTKDDIPEFFTQTDLGLNGDVVIYDISGTAARPLCRVRCGDDVTQQGRCFDRPVILPSKEQHGWQVYATVFPNGSLGGIIETVGGRYYRYTYFFTTDVAQFPLESPLIVRQEYSGVADENEGVYMALQNVKYGQDGQEERHTYGPGAFWDFREMTQEEFLASIESTWLGILRNLPRQRWSSPLVRTGEVVAYQDAQQRRPYTLAEILQIAEDLYAEYNTKLASGDY